MLEGPFLRFQNPYKKHWSQVGASGIPIGNLWVSGLGVSDVEGTIFVDSGIPIRNLGLKSGSLESLSETYACIHRVRACIHASLRLCMHPYIHASRFSQSAKSGGRGGKQNLLV